jgi:hypothetical protein
MDTVGEFLPTADQPESGQNGRLSERKSRSLDAPDEFGSSIERAGEHLVDRY